MVFADFALAQRLEATEAAACVDTAQSVGRLHPEIATATESIAGGCAVFTGVGSPISEARGLGMQGPVAEEDLERLEEFYRSRGDSVRMEVCPHADASLHELLARRGYRLVEFSNMLARQLEKERGGSRAPRRASSGAKRQRRAEVLVPSEFEGVSTRLVKPGEGSLWARTVAQCFAEHMPITQELMDIMSCWAHSPIAACFLGYVDGELAGGGAMAIHKDVALFGGAASRRKFFPLRSRYDTEIPGEGTSASADCRAAGSWGKGRLQSCNDGHAAGIRIAKELRAAGISRGLHAGEIHARIAAISGGPWVRKQLASGAKARLSRWLECRS
jgi:hypothetical protein